MQRRQRVDRRLDLLVVEVGDLVEHLVERAGLLTDRHHLHDHRREHRVLLERLRASGSPRLTACCVSRTASATTWLPTVSATISSDSRIGTPERTQRRQRAGEAGERGLAHELAEHRAPSA